jgi:hypothetical protein
MVVVFKGRFCDIAPAMVVKRIPLSRKDVKLFHEANVFDKVYNGGYPTAAAFFIGYVTGRNNVAPLSIVKAESVSIEYEKDGSSGYLKISGKGNAKKQKGR